MRERERRGESRIHHSVEDIKHVDIIADITTTIYYSTDNTTFVYNYFTTVQIILY